MEDFFKIIFAFIIVFLFFYNFFRLTPHAIIIGIYPYIIGIALSFGSIFIVLLFSNNNIVLLICNSLLSFILLFTLFTAFQIFRNSIPINGYQLKRSEYMDKLMGITKYNELKKIQLSTMQKSISTLIENNTGIPITSNNKVSLLSVGNKYIDEIIEEFSKAKDHIHVEFFIIRDDDIGNKFKDILIQKAREGVKVRLVFDGLGSRKLSKTFKNKLLKNNVEIGIFNSTIHSILKGKLNNRDHRKIIIVDGKKTFIGGFNIGNEYLDRDENIGEWNDMHVKVEGEVVNWAQKIFLADWFYITGEAIVDSRYFPENNVEAITPIQMITSGFDTHWNEISQLYFSLISNAQHKVYIATPYLILNDSIIKALQTAALRGVDVKIVLPQKPDVFIVGWANASFYETLLKAKVRIFLHEDGFIHSKIVITDNQIVSIGSANLNTRSLFLDYEVNAVIYHEDASRQVEDIFTTYLEKSKELEYNSFKKLTPIEKLKLWIGGLIAPFA